MPAFLYSFSDFIIFLILILFTITITIIFIFIDKLFIFNKLRYKDNTTISSISALIGIIYGVLVGFLCLYLINNQDHATQYTQAEANGATNIYRSSLWLPQPIQGKIQEDLRLYINTVIQKEWPLMSDFKKIGPEGDYILMKISDDLKSFKPLTNSETVILNDLLTSIKDLVNARHARINMSHVALPPEIWEVILIGTVLIIAINYAFRVNFYLHLFGTMTFAIMAASMLFLLVTLDTPFQGEFVVKPDGLQETLDLMKSF